MIFADTNVLLDVISRDPAWSEWSLGQLDKAIGQGKVFVSSVAYAELSIRYETIESLDLMLAGTGVEMADPPKAALFLAGKVFQR